jgi:hypothetical protein
MDVALIDLLAVLGGAAGIGGALAWAMSGSQRRYRAVRDAPPTPIRDVVAGSLCRIEGRVRPLDETVVAPLSGRPCAWWRARARGLPTDIGMYVARQDHGVSFTIEDDTGRATIDPTGAWVELRADFDLPHGTDRTKAWLTSRGTPRLANMELFFDEAVLVPGARISVMGLAHREPDATAARDGAYRDGTMPTRVTMTGSRRLRLWIIDA